MSNDPFPMRSEAAAKLAQGEIQEEWRSGDVTTSGEARGGSGKHVLEESRGLTGGKMNIDKYADDSDDEEEEFFKPQKNERIQRFLRKIFTRLYGDMNMDDLVKSLTLSSTLFFLIGGYWLLRSLKDPVLTALCGVQAIPKAKMLSVLVVLGVVAVYNKLIDFTESREDLKMHHLFYFFGTFYFLMFSGIAYFLTDEEIGLPNEIPNENRILGWVSYCTIESFGSVMVSLFWSFVNSNVSLEAAKATYGLIVASAQIGSILGPTVVSWKANDWGIPFCYFIGATCMLVLQGTMYGYITMYGNDIKSSDKTKKKEKAGILEGLVLFWKYNYVKGIFAISCLFMVTVTIVDYTMKVLARDYFSEEYPCEAGMPCYDSIGGAHGMSSEASRAFASFMGIFGQATNTLSFLLSLLGTSAVIRTLGLRITLLLFPSLCLIVILLVRMSPNLWTTFLAMMMLKANSYALNNPTKEMLYLPTSSRIKYKAKSWIDIFGARGSKALGSCVTSYFSYSTVSLVANGSLVGVCVSVFLIWNAMYMGKTFEGFVSDGVVVGEEEETHEVIPQILDPLNEEDGTSCAVEDDEDDDDEEEEAV